MEAGEMSDSSESPRHGAVPATHLNLADLPEAERFAVWKESISVIFGAAPAPDAAERAFTSRLATRHLTAIKLGLHGL
jgi:hypothetical protein